MKESAIEICKKLLGKKINSNWGEFEFYETESGFYVCNYLKISDEQMNKLISSNCDERLKESIQNHMCLIYASACANNDGTFNEIKVACISKENEVLTNSSGYATESGELEDIGAEHTFEQIWQWLSENCVEAEKLFEEALQ